MGQLSSEKKILSVFLTNRGTLIFRFETGAEEMIEAHHLHGLVGDVIAEFGENFRHKNRTHVSDMGQDDSKIVIPKGGIF